ncbi:hypothetical protein P0136_01085 [Lentisphaerota bacterium ZTH]|nr:hypothetical protein JYG24_07775 [Lentisphaerota bacterium]WET06607.1 hypothetical protein P0136_01085 [Lentisphaerota bacterium ZTH]
MVYCERKTPRRLLEDIEPLASAALGKTARRPFNRFKAEISPWWLVPGIKLPFYKYGKIYSKFCDSAPDKILCGFYLEKGLAPEVATVYNSRKGRSLIMTNAWQWRKKFLTGCIDGSFQEALSKAAASGLPVELHISGGYVDDPALFDPYAEVQKIDHFVWDLQPDGTELKYRCAKRDAMVLKILNKLKTTADLGAVMTEINDDHFMWLNVFAGTAFQVFSEDSSAAGSTWDATAIWRDFLSIFAPWIK